MGAGLGSPRTPTMAILLPVEANVSQVTGPVSSHAVIHGVIRCGVPPFVDGEHDAAVHRTGVFYAFS